MKGRPFVFKFIVSNDRFIRLSTTRREVPISDVVTKAEQALEWKAKNWRRQVLVSGPGFIESVTLLSASSARSSTIAAFSRALRSLPPVSLAS